MNVKKSKNQKADAEEAKKREIVLAMIEILKRIILLLQIKHALDALEMENAANVAEREAPTDPLVGVDCQCSTVRNLSDEANLHQIQEITHPSISNENTLVISTQQSLQSNPVQENIEYENTYSRHIFEKIDDKIKEIESVFKLGSNFEDVGNGLIELFDLFKIAQEFADAASWLQWMQGSAIFGARQPTLFHNSFFDDLSKAGSEAGQFALTALISILGHALIDYLYAEFGEPEGTWGKFVKYSLHGIVDGSVALISGGPLTYSLSKLLEVLSEVDKWKNESIDLKQSHKMASYNTFYLLSSGIIDEQQALDQVEERISISQNLMYNGGASFDFALFEVDADAWSIYTGRDLHIINMISKLKILENSQNQQLFQSNYQSVSSIISSYDDNPASIGGSMVEVFYDQNPYSNFANEISEEFGISYRF